MTFLQVGIRHITSQSADLNFNPAATVGIGTGVGFGHHLKLLTVFQLGNRNC